MDPAIVSATSALFGSLVGAASAFATTWLTQTSQLRAQGRSAMLVKREALYAEFVGEAARRLADAMAHQAEGPEVVVALYAAIGRMRMVSSREVVEAAQQVARLVVETYAAPNRSFAELRQGMAERWLDPLASFGEACRAELDAIGR